MSTGPHFRVFASFVVLVEDDADLVLEALPRLDEFLGERFDRHELVVVANAAPGVTAGRLADLGPLRGTLVLVELAHRHDKERAMLAGLSKAIGDFVFECEQLSNDWPLDLLTELFERCAEGVDVVDASGAEPTWSRRQFFSALNRFSYLDIPDHPVSVRVVSRRALNAMLDMREKVRYRRALYAAAGYPQAVVHYEPIADVAGGRRRQRIGHGFDVMVSFSDIGLRLANLAALVFGVFAGLAVVYTLLVFALKKDVVTGWTTLMLVVSFGFAGLFIVLSILGEYISRILIEVRHRPPFTVRASTVVPAHTPDRGPIDLTPFDDPEPSLDVAGLREGEPPR
ncbi:MAG: hypothetical protein U0Q07_19415 [Acidimicrobiales bacterium]